MRNRRYVQRKGPLVVYGNDAGIRCGAGAGGGAGGGGQWAAQVGADAHGSEQ